MPRRLLIRSKNLPYHVTARSHNKTPFALSSQEIWQLVKTSFKEAYAVHHIELISFVLMSNHYHMILLTPEGNLDQFLYEFNKRLALKIQKRTGQINQIFGGRYKWCLIQSQNYFMNCYRYVYQNPVRAGLSKDCQSYPFSTLNYALGNDEFVIPIQDKYGFKDEHGLRWLNQKIEESEKELLRKGLYRSIFQDPLPLNQRSAKVPGTFGL
jgi:putative transposase